jgi:hypothetical protein
MRKGYLQLCAFPGFLNMNGMMFESLIDENDGLMPREFMFVEAASRTAEQNQNFAVPTTFVSPRPTYEPHTSLRWRILVYDDCLRGRLCLGSSGDKILGAWNSIRVMPYFLLTPPCEHEPDSPARDLAKCFSHDKVLFGARTPTMPLLLTGRDYQTQLHKACQGYQDRRFSSQVVYYKFNDVAVHAEGCIRCAMKLCIDSGAKVLIS